MAATARILFADDEDVFLNSTADLLEREGYECARVQNGAGALELLGREAFDLLITDIRMPGNFHLELVREIAQREAVIPVIIVTGFPRLETAIDSIQLPVVAYVTKPFEFSTLLLEVQRSVARSRVAQAARNVEKRIEACREELSALTDGIALMPGGRAGDAADAFFESAFRNIAGSLREVRQVAEGLASGAPRTEPPPANSSREEQLREGVLDAIHVLTTSKGSFRSAGLGALRRRLSLLVGIEPVD